MVDYVLTVAVSISSAAQYASAAIEPLQGHEALLAIIATVFLMTVNLRGVKESGTAFAIPTYIFMASILGMAAYGFYRYFNGSLPEVGAGGLLAQGHTSISPEGSAAWP